jgi:hypothetical protein
MGNRRVALVALGCIALAVSGCATVPEEHKGAATGAAVGGAVGAAAGAMLGKDTKSAVIGGLLGALAGGAVGHYYYDKKRTHEETAKRYDYTSSTAPLVQIEEVSVTPPTVSPGAKLDLGATYALLGGDPAASLDVTETREIRHGSDLVGKPEVTVTRDGGTYVSSIPLVLSSTAKKGTYIVTTTVQTANAKDTRESSFTVE